MRKIEISLPRGVTGVSVDMDALSPDMVDALVAFALQSRITNAYASMPESEGNGVEEWTDEAHRHVAEAEDGSMRFGGGGGGKRTDAIETEARAIFVAALVKKGAKKADATKRSVKWRAEVSADVADRIVAKAKENVALRDDMEIEV